MSSPLPDSRLGLELELLYAMYPSQCTFNPRSRDFVFEQKGAGRITLRLPESYPGEASPDLIAAQVKTDDVRDGLRDKLRDLALEDGAEALDAIVACFIEQLDEFESNAISGVPAIKSVLDPATTSLTMIVWLHHLLATSKRKAALDAPKGVCGITKPGYPGAMLFTGPTKLVQEHVTALKGMRWQAFQIRYEVSEEWQLECEDKVIEVEKLSEIVDGIMDAKQKEVFLDVMKVK